VLEGVKNETTDGTSFHGSGYIRSAQCSETISINCYCLNDLFSMAILYACFALTNIFAPAIVSIIGASLSMFLGGITYLSVE
jgi:hypothetical protein